MKRYTILLILFFLVMLKSCEVFSKPLYTTQRGISGMLDSVSTEELADNVDKLATDPKKTAELLAELANRDQKDVKNLSLSNKEKILAAGVSAVLPTKQLGGLMGQIQDISDANAATNIMQSLCEGAENVDTRAIETILSDEEALKNSDVSSLTLSAASLIVTTMKKESNGGPIDDKMEAFKKASAAAGSGESYDAKKFGEELKKQGFDDSSISSLTVAMNTTQVLTGTAGEGKPNRQDDVKDLNFGGYNMGDFLKDMTGGK